MLLFVGRSQIDFSQSRSKLLGILGDGVLNSKKLNDQVDKTAEHLKHRQAAIDTRVQEKRTVTFNQQQKLAKAKTESKMAVFKRDTRTNIINSSTKKIVVNGTYKVVDDPKPKKVKLPKQSYRSGKNQKGR